MQPGTRSIAYGLDWTARELAGAELYHDLSITAPRLPWPAASWPRSRVSAVTPRPPRDDGSGERAALLAASWCARRLGAAYARTAWQLLADAARLGVTRHGRAEAWAAGAIVAVARADGVLGAEHAVSAQQIAEELDVTLGTLVATERELARAVSLAHDGYRKPQARAGH